MTARSRTQAHDRRQHEAVLAALRSAIPVWVALLLLAGATLGLAYAPLGTWHLPVAVGIALLQAALVLLVFMDLRRSTVLTRLCVTAAVLFATVMFALIFNDLFHRF